MTRIKKILIVDDSFNNLILLEDLLSEMNYEVTLAHDGVEAMERILHIAPDLILLDIMMPKMGGFELMETIQEKQLNIPVIFITAKNSEEERKKASDLGAADFIVKPVIINDVLDKIKKVFDDS